MAEGGHVLGWGVGGALMRLYAVVNKATGERKWFWTTNEMLAGYSTASEFMEFYDVDPELFEIELEFSDFLGGFEL
jgi:hypothetical protein